MPRSWQVPKGLALLICRLMMGYQRVHNQEWAKRLQSPEKEQQIGNAFASDNEVSDRREVVTFFALCSPLVRPLFGKCLPILYRLSTDCLLFLYVFCRETVDKHKTEGKAVPKLLRSSSE
ncbi:hypothetical protein [Sphingobacterium sp. xlx-130]|uniref:hypothetical protein n=1 Tax=Sphingobacterium sp. xlx-130 TaxID=2654323 RepID=UPI0013D953DC|nr:hypothetical protein [Sphingobacterium sp. xlx-130]